jgi:hypothetical protein
MLRLVSATSLLGLSQSNALRVCRNPRPFFDSRLLTPLQDPTSGPSQNAHSTKGLRGAEQKEARRAGMGRASMNSYTFATGIDASWWGNQGVCCANVVLLIPIGPLWFQGLPHSNWPTADFSPGDKPYGMG